MTYLAVHLLDPAYLLDQRMNLQVVGPGQRITHAFNLKPPP